MQFVVVRILGLAPSTPLAGPSPFASSLAIEGSTERVLFASLSDAAIIELWQDADAVLFAAVFGEAAPRLVRLLETHPPSRAAAAYRDSDQQMRAKQLGQSRLTNHFTPVAGS